jgi:hypothetical protein
LNSNLFLVVPGRITVAVSVGYRTVLQYILVCDSGPKYSLGFRILFCHSPSSSAKDDPQISSLLVPNPKTASFTNGRVTVE